MGGKSKSSTSTSQVQNTTNTQVVDTTTIGLDNVETGVVGSNNQVTKISTDHGAVEAGRAIGEASLDFAGETVEGAYGVARESLGSLERGLSDALDFGSGALGDALAFSKDNVATSLDFGADALSGALSFGAAALDANRASAEVTAKTLASAIDQAAQATRSDSADTLQKISKFGTVAVVAIVLGGIALVLFTRKKG